MHKAEIKHPEVKFVVAEEIDNALLTECLGATGCPPKIIENLVKDNWCGPQVLTENLQSLNFRKMPKLAGMDACCLSSGGEKSGPW